MDDLQIFTNFITNTLGVMQPRVRNQIASFASTFKELLAVTDEDIDTFFKETHLAKNARAAAQRMQIETNILQGLKSVLFELRDRELCDALPDAAMLQDIDAAQLRVMRKNRANAKSHATRRDAQSHPDMEVPKLTSTNWEEFDLAFTTV
eukprot:12824413-Ditylum_brightwellii.AAC.2